MRKSIWIILLVLILLDSVAAVVMIDGDEADVGRLLYADVSVSPDRELTSAVFEFSFVIPICLLFLYFGRKVIKFYPKCQINL